LDQTSIHLKPNELELVQPTIVITFEPKHINQDADITDYNCAFCGNAMQTLKFLLGDERIEKNVINANGYTAMDVCRKVCWKNSIDQEIHDCREGAKALPGKAAKKLQERDHTWSWNQHDALMVVASLIATMAFQVAMNPAGGVWQDNKTLSNVSNLGEDYVIFLIAN